MSTARAKPSRARSHPMIVDVAVDPQGKTLYRVHESRSLLQEATPLSSNRSDSSRFVFDSPDDLRSPAGTVSSTNLPCTDDQKPTEFDSANCSLDSADRRPSEPRMSKLACPSHDDIWSSDVEAAFEEALAIVPKCGLTKIKIGGKCCGRNELIADFISAKTGKFRSRKQVSSHIQVVKNMKLKGKLIRLINDGPEFSSAAEAEQNMKRFEEVFSKININKSLGLNSTGNAELLGSGGLLRRRSAEQLTIPPKRKKLPLLFISVRNISFTIDTGAYGSTPIPLTRQEETPMKFLSLKENANIASRFPGLEEFSNTNVSIIHNMVKVLSPLHFANVQSIDAGLKTNFNIDIPGTCDSLSSFTTVYSFGDEVLKVNEDDFETSMDQPFLVKFWKCFFSQLLELPTSLDTALKGITIKQVIYDNTVRITSILPKSKIKTVLLWEFSKVDQISEAVSSSSRLFLPPTLGYESMTTISSNYSIRPPNSFYNSSQHSNSPIHLFPHKPNPSISSLDPLSRNQNYDFPDLTRHHEATGISQISFPGVSLSSGIEQQSLYQASVITSPPLTTSLDGDPIRFFAQDEQQFLGNYYNRHLPQN
ncbi:TEA-domain-containing protein [Metschnikowia bicuspidata var. bicuspidata NRRL YB-4993]|uniref:TEA-domain-containing protein n=1 Tax=Metschnikowia bicuspidata var. bicuspidata NRRL YB-4993 TaxID=869754 RepID=A0A1A0H552_9ASCO|nr:TEA-domain-containing protein [Metschnikowia bicuspidata var. bicuspidata NRRL YB-4993]OBA19080.1 TEA-domain-containing protein [Metschnikowia bicuspidata var. bicuspidata NRRL YB-4993]